MVSSLSSLILDTLKGIDQRTKGLIEMRKDVSINNNRAHMKRRDDNWISSVEECSIATQNMDYRIWVNKSWKKII